MPGVRGGVLVLLLPPLCAALAPDANMGATYARLAARAAAAVAALPADGSQWWCAIAGGPGAGKSTLADAVAALSLIHI